MRLPALMLVCGLLVYPGSEMSNLKAGCSENEDGILRLLIDGFSLDNVEQIISRK